MKRKFPSTWRAFNKRITTWMREEDLIATLKFAKNLHSRNSHEDFYDKIDYLISRLDSETSK